VQDYRVKIALVIIIFGESVEAANAVHQTVRAG
jgi:hypothetical protein